MFDNPIGGMGLIPQRMFQKAVLGDGYTMNEVSGMTRNRLRSTMLDAIKMEPMPFAEQGLRTDGPRTMANLSGLYSATGDNAMNQHSFLNLGKPNEMVPDNISPSLNTLPSDGYFGTDAMRDFRTSQNQRPDLNTNVFGANPMKQFDPNKPLQQSTLGRDVNPDVNTNTGPQAPKPSPLGMLPAVGNLISLVDAIQSGPQNTQLDRVSFDTVDYNPIIAANNAAINRGVNTANYNVRNNARTFGQLGGNISSTNLRGAQAIGENTAKLEATERNTNAQIRNRESTLNNQIANQETMLNEQNEAIWRDRMYNDIIKGIGGAVGGYGADTAMMAADFARNQNYLEAMKYMSPMFRYLFDNKNLGMTTKYAKDGN